MTKLNSNDLKKLSDLRLNIQRHFIMDESIVLQEIKLKLGPINEQSINQQASELLQSIKQSSPLHSI